MQAIKTPEFKCNDTGFLHPADYDLTYELTGSVADEFIKRSIEGSDAYSIDGKQGMVLKRYEDGLEEAFDMATYARHHFERLRKTESVTNEVKLVFTDLSAEEIASSFVRFTDPAAREQLRSEIKFGSLLETTAWMAENFKQGCVKCAPFLARQMMKPYPDRPIQFVSSEQIPSFAFREKNMAYRLLQQALENPDQ